MASPAVLSNVAMLLLFIQCCLTLPLDGVCELGPFCAVFLSVLSSLEIIMLRLRLSYSVSLPHDAVCWSAVCDCGFSWSYSLAFFYLKPNHYDIFGIPEMIYYGSYNFPYLCFTMETVR